METLKCRECGKQFKHLGSHIFHKHNMLAREYKSKYELPYIMGLVTEEISEKQRKANKRNKSHQWMVKKSKKYRFKKGHPGQRRISEHERKVIFERILRVNKSYKIPRSCPVCRMKFNHLESHLFQKHGLIKVRR